MDSQEYIIILTEQIRCTKARGFIAEEIEVHIEDQTDTYLEFGIKKEEAYQKAVEQMGDPVAAGILYQYRGTSYLGIFKALAFLLVPVFIATRHIPSMQTGFTLTMVFGLMVVFAIAKGWFRVNRIITILVFVGTGPALLTVGYFFIFGGYQQVRLQRFWNPEPDYIQQYLRNLLGGSSLGGGGMEAVSAMNGFVPDQEQYIFTHLILGYGIIAGVVLICLLALLVIKTFHISFRQKNQLGMMVGVGTVLLLLIECSGFILMNLGFGLRSTWNLPFFSADGTATFVHYILMGLLLSIYRYKDILPKEQPAPRKALL